MGFLDRLKGVFAAKEVEPEIVSVTVPAKQLHSWIDTHLQERFSNVKSQLHDHAGTINAQRKKLLACVDKLESAKLQNENIHTRARQIMEGNRDTYIKKFRSFVENIEPPENLTYENSIAYVDQCYKELEGLKNNLGKATAVLLEFFANEVKGVNNELKFFVDSLSKKRKLLNAQSDQAQSNESAREMIDSFVAKLYMEKELLEKLSAERERFDIMKDDRDNLSQDVENYKTHKDYVEVKQLEKEKEAASKDLEKVRGDIRQKFVSLSRVLKKAAHSAVEHGDAIKAYAEDSAKALENDESLVILSVLNRFSSQLENNSLDAKNPEKLKSSIKELSKTTLQSFQSKVEELNAKRVEVQKRLQLSDAVRTYEDMLYKLSHLDEKLQHKQQSISEIQKRMEKQDVDGERRELENQLSRTFNVEMSIK